MLSHSNGGLQVVLWSLVQRSSRLKARCFRHHFLQLLIRHEYVSAVSWLLISRKALNARIVRGLSHIHGVCFKFLPVGLIIGLEASLIFLLQRL